MQRCFYKDFKIWFINFKNYLKVDLMPDNRKNFSIVEFYLLTILLSQFEPSFTVIGALGFIYIFIFAIGLLSVLS